MVWRWDLGGGRNSNEEVLFSVLSSQVVQGQVKEEEQRQQHAGKHLSAAMVAGQQARADGSWNGMGQASGYPCPGWETGSSVRLASTVVGPWTISTSPMGRSR
ncbi:hypothetical protein CKAH01_05252 [Colletotrichum kahawae]|uniref:Uncharacterized protein n=1 Tax=Colletotrichum kahawae TaxID=34407 RepID=A0AAD9YE35_COLKA|nr:hypothetical protein CKAH01_05252 [Colletotrichum kahawae]